jgi:hypothetical protein
MHNTLAFLVRINNGPEFGGESKLILSLYGLEKGRDRRTEPPEPIPKNLDLLRCYINHGIVVAAKSMETQDRLSDLTEKIAKDYGGFVGCISPQYGAIEFPKEMEDRLVKEYF